MEDLIHRNECMGHDYGLNGVVRLVRETET